MREVSKKEEKNKTKSINKGYLHFHFEINMGHDLRKKKHKSSAQKYQIKLSS